MRTCLACAERVTWHPTLSHGHIGKGRSWPKIACIGAVTVRHERQAVLHCFPSYLTAPSSASIGHLDGQVGVYKRCTNSRTGSTGFDNYKSELYIFWFSGAWSRMLEITFFPRRRLVFAKTGPFWGHLCCGFCIGRARTRFFSENRPNGCGSGRFVF